MDETVMKRLLAEVKNDILKQVVNTERNIMEKIWDKIKSSEEAIKKDINDFKKDVNDQHLELDDMKNRWEEVEKVVSSKTYAQVAAKTPTNALKENSEVDEIS